MDLGKLRKNALEHLRKNWHHAIFSALIILIFFGTLAFIIQFFNIFLILIYLLLYSPLLVGVTKYHYCLSYPKESKLQEYLHGYNYHNYIRSAASVTLKFFYLFWWYVLFIFPGLYKSISYAMTNYILQDADFSHLTVNQAITKSRMMMNGHKTEFIVLLISFIPWVLICIGSFGLGLFFVIPYFEQTKAEFYRELEKDIF